MFIVPHFTPFDSWYLIFAKYETIMDHVNPTQTPFPPDSFFFIFAVIYG